jgi:hypothetical protein
MITALNSGNGSSRKATLPPRHQESLPDSKFHRGATESIQIWRKGTKTSWNQRYAQVRHKRLDTSFHLKISKNLIRPAKLSPIDFIVSTPRAASSLLVRVGCTCRLTGQALGSLVKVETILAEIRAGVRVCQEGKLCYRQQNIRQSILKTFKWNWLPWSSLRAMRLWRVKPILTIPRKAREAPRSEFRAQDPIIKTRTHYFRTPRGRDPQGWWWERLILLWWAMAQ